MKQHLNVCKKRPLNISLILLSLLLAGVEVSNTQETIWYSSNVTITRNAISPDYFDIWSHAGASKCPLKLSRTICKDFGGFPSRSNCKELCCRRCICSKERPTFLAELQQCVEDRNMTRVSGFNQFVLTTLAGTSCATTTRLSSLDVTKAGNQSFLICLNGNEATANELKQCEVDANQDISVRSWNGSASVTMPLFKIIKVKGRYLKWSAGLSSLRGHIVSIPVNCSLIKFTPRNAEEYTIHSWLYFKVPGTQTGPGPKVFYKVAPALSTPTPVMSAHVSTTTDHKAKLNIVRVPGKVDLVLVVLAAILGSLLFLIIGAAIVATVVFFRRKQKLNISGKQSTSNPTYERGPDQSLINGGSYQSSYKVSSHFYQPLVENTRTVPRNGKDPIYESLDDNLRQSKVSLTENPNRCSLACCDVTSDGYLIPTGDEHTPPLPPSRLPTIPSSNTHNPRPRLSSSYDEPEVVISDRKPKQTVQNSNSGELKSPDDTKPTYEVLEETAKESDDETKLCVDLPEPRNESVSNVNKSPTENSYLELIGDAIEPRHPLESETL